MKNKEPKLTLEQLNKYYVDFVKNQPVKENRKNHTFYLVENWKHSYKFIQELDNYINELTKKASSIQNKKLKIEDPGLWSVSALEIQIEKYDSNVLNGLKNYIVKYLSINDIEILCTCLIKIELDILARRNIDDLLHRKCCKQMYAFIIEYSKRSIVQKEKTLRVIEDIVRRTLNKSKKD